MADGNSSDYDSLMGKDVFEFYSILKSYKKRIKAKDARGSIKNNRR